jgi:hypothetical protein
MQVHWLSHDVLQHGVQHLNSLLTGFLRVALESREASMDHWQLEVHGGAISCTVCVRWWVERRRASRARDAGARVQRVEFVPTRRARPLGHHLVATLE